MTTVSTRSTAAVAPLAAVALQYVLSRALASATEAATIRETRELGRTVPSRRRHG